MVILADSTDALASPAQSAGAATNDEVDYIDSRGCVAHRAACRAQCRPGHQHRHQPHGRHLVRKHFRHRRDLLGGRQQHATSAVTATTSAIIDFDATRDLVPLSLSGQPAFLLNPHPHAYNVANAGTIRAPVSLTGVSTLTDAGNPDVQVSAEALSSDGTRHVIIKTTRVGSDGTFTLYPLSTASGAPTRYDLVIHGPAIATVIIKSVPVTDSAPGSATTGLGTVMLTAATPFLVNVNSASPAAPTSSLVGFYQTLPLSSEVPYLIEVRAVDPISGVFASAQDLSGGPLQYGTYSAGTVSLTAATPSQGAATYSIGAINPAYGTAPLGTTVTAASSAATTALFALDAPPLPAGSTANAIQGTISVSGSGFDTAELFLTSNGALVAAAPLTAYLGTSRGTLSLSAIAPGGSSSTAYAAGVYYAEVWAWSSANPTGTLTRIPYGSTIDMSAGNATGVALQIN